ncbi:MAG: hypothetical protein R8P61_12720 [Bacteroidia bacterium]|nr:hypothetical protein [Bacteroidia bacterium]
MYQKIRLSDLLIHLLWIPLVLTSCIGDDIIDDEVDPMLRIINPIDTIAFDSTYQFQLSYLNNIGREEPIQNVNWTSSAPTIIEVNSDGLAKGLMTGEAFLKAEVEVEGEMISDELLIQVGEQTTAAVTERTGTIETTSFYTLEGSFSLSEVEGDMVLAIGDDWKASSNLPGLYVYLTNNPSTTSGAYEIGEVTIFEGEHSYNLGNEVGLNDYEYVLYFCKPFNVKVGDGAFDN